MFAVAFTILTQAIGSTKHQFFPFFKQHTNEVLFPKDLVSEQIS